MTLPYDKLVGYFVRFLIIGALSLIFSLLLLYVLVEWAGMHYLGATVVVFISANLISFALNKYRNFRTRNEYFFGEMGRYYLVMLSSLLLNLLLMYVLVDVWELWYFLAGIVSAIVLTVYNFLLHVYFSFRVGAPEEPSSDDTSF